MQDSIGESLHKLIHSYKSTLRETAIQSGIKLPVGHIRLLKSLKKEGCIAKAVATQLCLDKSQVTRVINDLVERGYLTKERHPTNHRSSLLILTHSGKTLLDDIQTFEKTISQEMAIGLTDQQVDQFIQIADTMRHNLEQTND
ncbi:MarR family winged helix-turn-helix transcriptional regulator [Marinomonas spartinae]|uniref:MarR family winged helix-turn-helix transcriptional regulator n=1 Tax=Marinomonas spartinae TaxID=1792290 RepID=UPI0018F1EBD9|nr:MarR family transcriptional regulator [Marinomonas spartinae]MBJ7554065.1 MarR family transcriptional regulator [Marinomonas spartinae]